MPQMSSWAATGRVRGPYNATDRGAFFPVPSRGDLLCFEESRGQGLRGRGQGEVAVDAILL